MDLRNKTGMRVMGMRNMEWIDKEEWRRKIKRQTQKGVQSNLTQYKNY